MLDRAAFLRPIAHRGLHDPARGIVENTGPAFEAAIAQGYGIECDLRSAGGGLPIVFHDLDLDRLVEGSGPVGSLTRAELGKLRHKESGAPILTFSELLELVGGRVPLLVEIKSEWDAPDIPYLAAIAQASAAYKGPLALMSFDPALMTALRHLAPDVPRGIVSGAYRDLSGERWWAEKIGPLRAWRLAHLLEAGPVRPSFIAYDVKGLPTLMTSLVRNLVGLPLFTWTVCTEDDRRIAVRYADAAIFEGEPA